MKLKCYICYGGGGGESLKCYIVKTVQINMTRSGGVIYFMNTVQINMTRSLRCCILYGNGADGHDQITEVLYTL